MGVIDGHDVRALRRALREALAAERPVVVHIATVKGKGFAPAEEGGLEGMEKWHAAKPKSIANGAPGRPPRPRPPSREARAAAVHEGLRRGDGARSASATTRVVGITAAMNSGTGLSHPQKAMPDRYFDVGIAEQQRGAVRRGPGAAGRASRYAAIYSTFLQRAFDQIVHDVCLQTLNVVFAMDRAGLVGDDGPTHHGVFDIAYLRCLPNIVLMAPRDEAMLVHMLRTALHARRRPDRAALPARRGRRRRAARRAARRRDRHAARSCARASGWRSSATAPAWGRALEAADLLAERGLDVTVADARFAKPIDAGLMAQLAAEHDLLVTVEEGVLAGGFGSAVWETPRRGRRSRRASCASACPTATSPTASPRCCTRRSASPAERIAERIEAAVMEPRSALTSA